MFKRALTIILSTYMFVFIGGVEAYAHAELVESNPKNGVTVKARPNEVTLTFNEPVSVERGGVQLLDSRGKVLSSASAQTGTVIKVRPPKLEKGRYLVRYRIISSDGHVIIESITFSYGLATPRSKPISQYLSLGGENVGFFLSGSRAGELQYTINIKGLSGRAEFKNTRYGSPIVSILYPGNESMRGAVLLPSSGKWNVLVRVRVSDYDERVLTGVLDVKS